ncbi:MAG: orotidine-5'-phosphate decarboxylase [Planctomycetota bacterium]
MPTENSAVPGTMATTSFASRLTTVIESKKTPLVVGLDPRIANLPQSLRKGLPEIPTSEAELEAVAARYFEFCKGIIDVVAPLVPAVKPQAAFFEQLGPHGMKALNAAVKYARDAGLLVIMDAKRGDIGSTATAYAGAFLGPDSPWGADALTVNPYMGTDTLEPFTVRATRTGSGIFVLVKTSNPGSGTLQELVADGATVYQHVARHIQQLNEELRSDSEYGPVGAVVGATYPEQLAELRKKMSRAIFLVPGVGAQGGMAADVAAAFDENGHGAVINSSRAIIFAWQRPEFESATDWQNATELATRQTIDQIADQTNAGRLRN